MRLTEFALALGAIAFAVFGIWLFVNPRALKTVGIPADNADARAEIRAMYGGLELGIAAFLALSLFRAEWIQAALVFLLLALGGLAIGRLAGVMLEGGRVTRLLWLFVAIELAAVAVTFLALRAL